MYLLKSQFARCSSWYAQQNLPLFSVAMEIPVHPSASLLSAVIQLTGEARVILRRWVGLNAQLLGNQK